MKRILTFIFILTIVVSGCGSSKKQLRKGNYDAPVAKAVKQLRKDPKDVRQINILTQAYKIANDQDNESVSFLKIEGRPDSWEEIYLGYKSLSDRQSLVRTVTPLNADGKSVDFPYVDYIPDMVNARRKAADFYFAHGNELVKDTLGNDIKQKKYKTLQCALGDIQALNAKQPERTRTSIVPFPTDIEMVMRCSESLKQAIRGTIQNNRRFIL